MKILIIYDSQYGNTEKIARSVAKGFSAKDKVSVIHVREAASDDVRGVELLIVGSPTHGGQATEELQEFFVQIPKGALSTMKVAAFDTGFKREDQNFALKLLIKTIGYAAPKIAKALQEKGGKLVVPPEGFYVKGKQGPLLEGEIERAKEWAKKIV